MFKFIQESGPLEPCSPSVHGWLARQDFCAIFAGPPEVTDKDVRELDRNYGFNSPTHHLTDLFISTFIINSEGKVDFGYETPGNKGLQLKGIFYPHDLAYKVITALQQQGYEIRRS